MCCFHTYVLCVEVSLMNVVYRVIGAVFLHSYKTNVLIVEFGVLVVLY
jgi:hypothetical protein